jgi:O-antigen ligase
MRHPEIYFPEGRNFDNRLHWEHAHNDWLQWPIEYGAVGMLLLAITPMFLLVRFAQAWAGPTPFTWTLTPAWYTHRARKDCVDSCS